MHTNKQTHTQEEAQLLYHSMRKMSLDEGSANSRVNKIKANIHIATEEKKTVLHAGKHTNFVGKQ